MSEASGFIEFTAAEVRRYYRERLPRLRQTSARNWSTPCPLHVGKNPNFSINAATGQWRCHSKCNRGGGLLDFEIQLTGADFVSARNTVFSIVGRPIPEPERRKTAEEWEAEKRARAELDRLHRDSGHFARAAKLIAEAALEQLTPDLPDEALEECAVHTRLIADLREDARAVYIDWRARTPEMTEALRRAGYRSEQRERAWLTKFTYQMAKEYAEVQFKQTHREEWE